MYGETNLGATDEAVITFLQTPMNSAILTALKKHVYPEFAEQFDATENSATTNVPEPPTNPGKKGKKSSDEA